MSDVDRCPGCGHSCCPNKGGHAALDCGGDSDAARECNIRRVLSEHRVNYHQRNVGGETASTLRFTSCEGCDWLGGWHDEEGWEEHLASLLIQVIPAGGQR